MPVRNLVGPRVREARLSCQPKITQAQLAARMQLAGFSLDRVSVAKVEIGLREVTDRELMALADSLGVSVMWLLRIDETSGADL